MSSSYNRQLYSSEFLVLNDSHRGEEDKIMSVSQNQK